MTTAQIKAFGIATDKWDTLENVCEIIQFGNEGKQFVSPTTYQFYFDTASELLFVRYTHGKPVKAENKDPNIEYAEVNLVIEDNVEKRYIPLVGGGINDSTVGKYHVVYDSTKIISFIA